MVPSEANGRGGEEDGGVRLRPDAIPSGFSLIRGLNGAGFRRDALAGLAVWAAAVPGGLAYATIAGLPPVVGLYGSAVAGLAYVLFGTIRQAQVGPTSTTAILTAAALAPLMAGGTERALQLAAVLALEVAALLTIAWALKLSFIADLLSRPVVIGFTAAVTLVIIAAQLPNLLGLDGVSTRNFSENIGDLVNGIEVTGIDVETLGIGVASLAALLLMRRLAPRLPRELIVVVLATVATAALGLADTTRTVGAVPSGLPAPAVPGIAWSDVLALLPAAAGVSLIAFTENIAIGRAMGGRHHYEISPRREIVALGAANAAAGLFGSFPAGASFAQTALGDSARARTPLATVVAKAAVIATLLLLTPLFTNVPYAALAAVVISAVLSFIDVPGFRRLLRFQRATSQAPGRRHRWIPEDPEVWSALATFVGTLVLGLLNGILVGVFVTLAGLLYRASRPRVSVLGKVPGLRGSRDVAGHPEARVKADIMVIQLESELFFGNADYFRRRVLEILRQADPTPSVVVFACDAMAHVDLTGVEALSELISELQQAGIEVRLCQVSDGLYEAFVPFGIVDLVGPDHFYGTIKSAIKDKDPEGEILAASVEEAPSFADRFRLER